MTKVALLDAGIGQNLVWNFAELGAQVQLVIIIVN